MAVYETLDVLPNRGGSRTTTPRAKRTEYVDGYSQKVIVGLHKSTANVSFSYTGTYAKCKEIEDFLNANITTAFYFRFMPSEPYRLYETSDDISLVHEGGLRWTVSATFKQYIGF